MARGGSPGRRIANQQTTGKLIGFRVQQNIEIEPPCRGKGMRRGAWIDRLAAQHVQLPHAVAQPLEMRQVRMDSEGRNALQQPSPIKFREDSNGVGDPSGIFAGRRPKRFLTDRPRPSRSETPKSPKHCLAGMAGSPWWWNSSSRAPPSLPGLRIHSSETPHFHRHHRPWMSIERLVDAGNL